MLTHLINPEFPMAARLALAFTVSLAFCLIFGQTIIHRLISLKVGQPIRSADEVRKLAELHGAKAGTPTMGGVMILAGTTLGTLLFGDFSEVFTWLCLGAMLALSLLGLADDYLKVRYKSSDGIAGRVKLIVQGLVGIVAGVILYSQGYDEIFVPFLGTVALTWWIFIPFVMVTMMACSNAVNLTDGLDGLAAGCTVPNTIAYAIIALGAGFLFPASYINPGSESVAIFLLALAGGCVGFLWFNCYPAKVFMGDTGSLAIGGALGMAAICLKQELLFIVIGAVFFMEALSVVMQVVYFKATKGKRIFLMSPIHHHFELKGWKETQVFQRFWILSLLAAILGLTLITLC